MHNAQFDKFV